MTVPAAASETPLWRFSLHFYRQAGVAEACIALQDECGVDVNLLLFLLWLAAGRRQVSAANVKELDAAVGDWRQLTIVPIREVRRKLKGEVTLVEANKQEAFRTKIKAIELEAERLQQEALYSRSRSALLGREAAPAAAARANLAAYEQVLAVRFPKAALDRLVGAFDAVKFDEFVGR
ncbi:MAG TPA: TIGR02444 family protein [Xanthobacteraceae bacterium]|jgi:uncharacterized protein (TIGR02444 family)|nr:TIGR02444 family protein [Xanthobacteraceae bacterium]